MSEREFNEKVRMNRNERKARTLKRAAIVCVKALGCLSAFVTLWAVNFIALPFLTVLALCTVCWTAFRLGGLCAGAY